MTEVSSVFHGVGDKGTRKDTQVWVYTTIEGRHDEQYSLITECNICMVVDST